MNELLQMSLSGGCMILVIALVRAIGSGGRLPRALFTALWGLACLRLLIPYRLPSSLNLFSLTGATAGTAAQGPPTGAALPTLFLPAAEGALPQGLSTSPAVSPLFIIWAAGALALSVFFLCSYFWHLRRFSAAQPVEDAFTLGWMAGRLLRRTVAVHRCASLKAPLTYGILRPVILLPATLSEQDETTLGAVLSHEWQHIRRWDALKKLVLALTVCLHWFNPLVWLMFSLAGRDIELGCDAAVVKNLGATQRAGYAKALLSLEETKGSQFPLAASFNRHALTERIGSIMKHKKTGVIAALLSLAIIAGVATVLGTSAKLEPSMPTPPSEPISQHEGESPTENSRGSITYFAGRGTSTTAGDPMLFDEAAIFAEWARFGITTDENGRILYEGAPVRFFMDDRQDLIPGQTGFCGTFSLFMDGDALLATIRDENGTLTGIRHLTQQEADELTGYSETIEEKFWEEMMAGLPEGTQELLNSWKDGLAEA